MMSRAFVGALVVGAIGLLIAATVWTLRVRLPEVSFKEVPVSEPNASPDSGRPALRVAIAAMVSPSITKRFYEDLLDVIGDRVGRQTQLIQRKTYAEVNDLVENRVVDLAFVCSGPFVQGRDKFGMERLAVPIVDGAPVYYSYILAQAGSRTKSLAELRGKRFAFTDPDSNTGCLSPRFLLARMGETPASFFQETFFTHSHDNSIKAVAEGLADGAAVDSLIYDFLKVSNPALVSGTVVIHKSAPFGIPPLVVHPGLDPVLKARLKQVLLTLHQDPATRRLLDGLRVERFVEGDDQLYASIREMQAWIATRD